MAINQRQGFELKSLTSSLNYYHGESDNPAAALLGAKSYPKPLSKRVEFIAVDVTTHLKKLRKILIAIFIFFGLPIIFILLTNYKLEGTWIGQYSVHPGPDIYLGNERILTFETISFIEEGPKYELGRFHKGYFLHSFKTIKSQNGSYRIDTFINDSLVIRNLNDSTNYRTYIRVPDSLRFKKQLDLVGKKFLLENGYGKDTLHFKSDSVFYASSINRTLFWELLDHEGFRVLFMEEYVPFLVTNKIEKNISLKRIGRPNHDYTLTELQ